MYQLSINGPAGDYRVVKFSEEGPWPPINFENYREVGIYETQEELDAAISAHRGDTVFAVFENRPSWEAYIAEEDSLSGNWRGSKHGFFSLAGEYDTREEAEKHLKAFYNR